MKIVFKLPLLKRVVIDFGMKEPDLITGQEVLQYCKEDDVTPKLKAVHKRFKHVSRRYHKKEIIVRNLTPEEILILKKRGFTVKCYTKMKKGKVVFQHNHYRVIATNLS